MEKIYTCPMHPEVESDKPNSCPKCGMDLELKGKDLKQGHKRHDSKSEHADHHNHHEMMVKDFKKRFFFSLVLTIPILILSPLVQEFLGFEISFIGDKYLLFALSAIVFFYGGWPFLKGIVEELRKRQPGMMTLIALAISVAFLYSTAVVFGLRGKFFFWELATLIDIMLLGHWIEMRSIMGASKALESLAKLIPSKAHLVKEDGTIIDVSVSELLVDNIVLVKPGGKIPADGVVVKGETSVNEAMLTGESKPVSKKIEDQVIGGSINGQGAVNVKIAHTGKDSYISQVINLVKQAQASKSKTQDFANKAAMWLTIVSISIGVMTLLFWLYFGKDFAFAVERMATVMVITCPHALGLAIPLVVSVSTSLSAQNGLLIRNRMAFERAKELQVIVFDKTGTLTKGEFGITDIISLNQYKEEEILSYAASLDVNSEHPIAKGILKKAKEKGVEIKEVQGFKYIPGKGVQGTIDGKEAKIVGYNYLKEKGIEANNPEISELSKQGKTVSYLFLEDEIIGAIALADLIREESKEAIDKLKSMGIKNMMLTGDNKEVAKWVADELGLDDFFAGVLPNEKSEVIRKIQSQGLKVAMVGDGVNDAPALAQADVGVAIGAGTDVAIESADIILVRNDPRDVASIILLAKATFIKMQQNLFWATGYNIVAIPLAAGLLYNYGILLSPAIGAVFMSLSTIIVAINARFLSIGK
ncbi:MAG: copper-translocating P-type ATPase [Patescibacteria group bacterium]|nr:copper-translocating P-type ATPase [Patescibacteria group bacterium]